MSCAQASTLPHFSLSLMPSKEQHEQYGKPTFHRWCLLHSIVSLSFVIVGESINATYCAFYLLRSLLRSDAFFLSDTHFSFYIYRSSMRIRSHERRQIEGRSEKEERKKANSDIMRFDHTGICDANIRDRDS